MTLYQLVATGLVCAGLAAAQLRYADNQVDVVRDSEEASKHFPDVDGVELLSPAFTDPKSVPDGFENGTSGPTDEATLDYFLRTLEARNGWMTYHNPPFKSEDGRSIPYVFLSTASQPRTNSSAPEKVRVWLQGGVHGNEPGGDQALLALLGKLDANATWAASILEKLDIMVLPRYNPDGVAYFQRFLATSLDPNRDHTKLASQQTRDIKALVQAFAPHVGVDSHEYSASRPYGAHDQWVQAIDGQISAMKNLHIHGDIRHLAEATFVPRVAAAMEGRGLRWSPYVTGTSGEEPLVLTELNTEARAGDISIALNQALVFLTETRGIMLGGQHFQRRVAAGLTMVEAIVQTAADNADQVYEVVEGARNKFVQGHDDIVITDTPRPTNTTWQFIQVASGKLVSVPVQFLNTTPVTANLTRARPEAYVFPRAYKGVAERLQIAGVQVDILQSEFRGEVEALNITTAAVADSIYEGTVLTTVTTTALKKEVRMPAGSYWVSTRQPRAAHAFVTLEPESVDSYTTFNVLPVGEGDEYPVYRVMA